jgi:hypothetical protein
MDTFDMVLVLQSAASQWIDYLEDSKKYGDADTLETDREIADVKDALIASDRFIQSIKDLGIMIDAKRAIDGISRIVHNLA